MLRIWLQIPLALCCVLSSAIVEHAAAAIVSVNSTPSQSSCCKATLHDRDLYVAGTVWEEVVFCRALTSTCLSFGEHAWGTDILVRQHASELEVPHRAHWAGRRRAPHERFPGTGCVPQLPVDLVHTASRQLMCAASILLGVQARGVSNPYVGSVRGIHFALQSN